MFAKSLAALAALCLFGSTALVQAQDKPTDRKRPSWAALMDCCESVGLSLWTGIRTVFRQ